MKMQKKLKSLMVTGLCTLLLSQSVLAQTHQINDSRPIFADESSTTATPWIGTTVAKKAWNTLSSVASAAKKFSPKIYQAASLTAGLSFLGNLPAIAAEEIPPGFARFTSPDNQTNVLLKLNLQNDELYQEHMMKHLKFIVPMKCGGYAVQLLTENPSFKEKMVCLSNNGIPYDYYFGTDGSNEFNNITYANCVMNAVNKDHCVMHNVSMSGYQGILWGSILGSVIILGSGLVGFLLYLSNRRAQKNQGPNDQATVPAETPAEEKIVEIAEPAVEPVATTVSCQAEEGQENGSSVIEVVKAADDVKEIVDQTQDEHSAAKNKKKSKNKKK